MAGCSAAAAGAAAAAAAAAAVCPKLGAALRAVRREDRELLLHLGARAVRALGVSPLRTSSSKCDSHFMHTYS